MLNLSQNIISNYYYYQWCSSISTTLSRVGLQIRGSINDQATGYSESRRPKAIQLAASTCPRASGRSASLGDSCSSTGQEDGHQSSHELCLDSAPTRNLLHRFLYQA
ncbi:unnamed protein product [Protopolystoma xenopodis]|uniref:Uncharacterized protein n=1 Tax=Protopolystoma xenopodis TaxID=117903 RepID=A0A448XQS0_9PLAT|nr:unnamed protein product [Protopolystoma xenopodis]